MTDSGIVILSVTCIFDIAAVNSLTVVVSIKYMPSMIPGRNRDKMPQIASSRKFTMPVVRGPKYQKQRYAAV